MTRMAVMTGCWSAGMVPLPSVGWAGLAHSVHYVHAVGHIAEAGVLAVKESAVCVADEELRAGAVGVLAPGHGNGAPGVGSSVFSTPLEENSPLLCSRPPVPLPLGARPDLKRR